MMSKLLNRYCIYLDEIYTDINRLSSERAALRKGKEKTEYEEESVMQ